MKIQATTNKKSASINAVTAQAGIAITVTTRKESAKKLKSLEPLAVAMKVAGDETSVGLLSRLPSDTIAFQHFAQNAMGTAQLFSWFDNNQTRLTRTTKEGKYLLDIAGAYCAAFGISHDRAVDGPLKEFPFYKKFSNSLQQWAKLRGGVSQRESGSITDAVCAYLDKKERDNAAALGDSLVAWVLKNENILTRIKKALETPA